MSVMMSVRSVMLLTPLLTRSRTTRCVGGSLRSDAM
jgi:hypothetical protein